MKKIISALTVLCLMLCLFTGCGKTETALETTAAPATTDAPAPETKAAAEPVELIVFAAASMTETMTTLGEQYMADHPEVTIVFNFDSSGTLKTQIQEGSDCDIFISAGQKQMNQLDITADVSVNTEGLDFVLEGTRFTFWRTRSLWQFPKETPRTSIPMTI